MSSLRRVLVTARPLRARLALGVLLGALAIGAGVALMATSGYLISRAALRPEILSLAVTIVGVRFFGISRGVFRYAERLASHDAALRLLARLRVTFFTRLEPLVPEGLPAETRSGDLLGRFVADVDELQNVFVRAVGPPLVAVLVGAGAVLTAGLVDLRAGLVLAAALVGGGLLVPAASAALVRSSARREAPVRAALLADVVSTLDAAPELVVFGGREAALARIDGGDGALTAIRSRAALAEGMGDGLVTLAAGLAAAGMLVVAVPHVRGVLLAMLALLALASFEAVRPLPAAAQQLGAADEAASRVYDVVDRPAPVLDPPTPAPRPEGRTLEYGGVRLRRGVVVALVGPSGAGKTRLAHLLVRFRDPEFGAVLLDGRDLRAYTQADVRSTVLLSDQDAHLFATSIRENLRIARPDATDDELRAALRRARALDWVETLPDDLDTHVGEHGALVSGGQRQRLALARAFLSDAPFVIFDEPTAHLDAPTAAEVVETILELPREGRGVLLISHTDDVADAADEVVEL
ncbi:MAG: thiol reductant ABC exporter subunit CydC [Actinomycetota bacterium]